MKLLFRSLLYFLIAYTVISTVSGCRSPSATSNQNHQLHGRLIITGSSTIAPLVTEIGLQFEKHHNQVRVDVQSGGSSRGITDTRQGIASIGMVSRALYQHETDLTAHPLARDGIAIIIHKDNPISALSANEIRAIYTGEINNWSKIGGNKASITVINKAEGRSTLEVFLKFLHLKNSQVQPDIIIGENEQAIKLIANNRNAIGYVSIGTATYGINRNVTIKMLPINGIMASTENIANGKFPIHRELNLITDKAPSLLAQQFIAFAQSQTMHAIIEAQSLVPFNP